MSGPVSYATGAFLLLAQSLATMAATDGTFRGLNISFVSADASCTQDGNTMSSLPTFHTQADLTGGTIPLCLNIDDLFAHPNRTNITLNGINLNYSLSNMDSYDNTTSYSAVYYANEPLLGGQDYDDSNGAYWVTLYNGRDCLQETQPYPSLSCADEGACYRYNFTLASFLLHDFQDNGNGECDDNVLMGDPNATGSAGMKAGGTGAAGRMALAVAVLAGVLLF